MAIHVRLDQYFAAERHRLGRALSRVPDPDEVEPMGMTVTGRQRMNAGTSVIVARQDHVLDAVIALHVEHVVTEGGFVEGCAMVWIAREQRTPDPFAGRCEEIRRIAAGRG